jgi:hypothetical protein
MSNNHSGGFIAGLLGVAFVVLKLIGIINWSWWFVLLPFYGMIALIIAIWFIIFIVAVIFKGIERLSLWWITKEKK